MAQGSRASHVGMDELMNEMMKWWFLALGNCWCARAELLFELMEKYFAKTPNCEGSCTWLAKDLVSGLFMERHIRRLIGVVVFDT